MSDERKTTDKPALPLRLWRKLRKDGVRGLFAAVKQKYYRRKDLIVCVRDNEKAPLRRLDRFFIKGQEICLAEMKHLDAMAANFPHKREWYRERLTTPGYYCTIAVLDGEVIAHNWFCTKPHRDPEMKCVIDPGPRGAYWFEGWCREDYRGRGLAYFGFDLTFRTLFPQLGLTKAMTLLEESNVPTRRLHKKWHFEDVGRMTHIRLGPFRYTSKIKPLKPDQPAAAPSAANPS